MLAEAGSRGAERANSTLVVTDWSGEPRGNNVGARGRPGEGIENQSRCAEEHVFPVELDVLSVVRDQLGQITVHEHTTWIPEPP